MGFTDFLKKGGSGIISGVLGGGMGLIGQGISARQQRKMQQEAFEYGREMFDKQSQAELQRMGLQFDYNKRTAEYNQDLAKKMYDYTFNMQNEYNNPASEKARYEAAGLNPALLYGGGGAGGSSTAATSSGGSMPAVTPIQPMGIQVALQAEAQKAQIELTKAQTNSIKADTMKKVTADMASAGLDLITKNLNNNAAEVNTEKAKQEIFNLKKTNEQIGEQINKLKNENKLAEFQNWLNDIKRNAAEIQQNGAKLTYEDLFKMKELQGLKTELKELGTRFDEADFEQNKIVSLFNNLEDIVKGETDGYKINSKKYEEMDWNLKNDKAFGDLLNELGTDSKYSKLLLGIIKYFFTRK